MKLRMEIKESAKKNFSDQYGVSVAALLIFAGIGFIFAALPSLIALLSGTFYNNSYVILRSGITTPFSLASIFLMPPLTVGYAYFCLRIYKGEKGDIGNMFNAGFANYGRNLGGMLWMELFVILWSLLFIIPGIIKAIAYFMTPYILADSKNVKATDAIKLSMRMTNGHKGEIFVMGLSFIGWAILSALTMGILGIFYTGPYMSTSFAGLYEELKNNAVAKGIVKTEELE